MKKHSPPADFQNPRVSSIISKGRGCSSVVDGMLVWVSPGATPKNKIEKNYSYLVGDWFQHPQEIIEAPMLKSPM